MWCHTRGARLDVPASPIRTPTFNTAQLAEVQIVESVPTGIGLLGGAVTKRVISVGAADRADTFTVLSAQGQQRHIEDEVVAHGLFEIDRVITELIGLTFFRLDLKHLIELNIEGFRQLAKTASALPDPGTLGIGAHDDAAIG